MNHLIKVEGVSKCFNCGRPNEIWPVREVSLYVKKGEVVVLKGPSGSGKTTLLGLIGCMSRPTSGRIIVKGQDVAKLPERFLTEVRRKTFGFIFQQFNLIKGISVRENILLPLYPTGMSFSQMSGRVEELMESLSLSHRASFHVEILSGGEQQRVAIARALVNRPDILMADEPTAHLDSKLSMKLLETLKTLKQQGMTIVIATHDPIVFETDMVDRVYEVRDGRITEK